MSAHDDLTLYRVIGEEGCREWVYLAEAGDTGYFKVGTSRDPEKRLHRLSGISPFPLRLCAAIPGDHDEEAGLHRRFRPWWSHGEWFLLNPCRELVARLARRSVTWADVLELYCSTSEGIYGEGPNGSTTVVSVERAA